MPETVLADSLEPLLCRVRKKRGPHRHRATVGREH
jgi:hypothetical protein